MIKKTFSLIISFVLILSGCGRNAEYQSNIEKKLERLPTNYYFNDAVADNCVVVAMGERHNIDTLNNFINEVKKNRPCSLRYVVCSEKGDDLIIQDVYFDTNQFIVFFDFSRNQNDRDNIEYHIYNEWHFQEMHNEETKESREEIALLDDNAEDEKRSVIIG